MLSASNALTAVLAPIFAPPAIVLIFLKKTNTKRACVSVAGIVACLANTLKWQVVITRDQQKKIALETVLCTNLTTLKIATAKCSVSAAEDA